MALAPRGGADVGGEHGRYARGLRGICDGVVAFAAGSGAENARGGAGPAEAVSGALHTCLAG